jgi:hypothetical protein
MIENAFAVVVIPLIVANDVHLPRHCLFDDGLDDDNSISAVIIVVIIAVVNVIVTNYSAS